ncbi:MAG TPA: Fic family protein [Candidatus Angelobacter sp.]|nr:Fic family protein [Candidatus Angelobacter sp.]
MSDPYLDPQSGILLNKFGLSNQESLNLAEANAVSMRSVLLQLNPVKGNFDSEHLKAIHWYLFRDVYEWAGEFRKVPLAKADYVHLGQITRFTPPELIEPQLGKVFGQLAAEHFLEGLQRRDFARKVAVLLSEINRIHPFREGNGRAQRHFVRQLAESLGYKIHFGVVSKERVIQASILSTKGDVAMMERLLDEITDTERIQPLAKVIALLETNHFNWNDYYLATTTPGQNYAGTFAGSDGTNFFFRDDENRIFVGNLKDLKRQAESGQKIIFTAS